MKEKIIEIATQKFLDKGFKSVTLDDIANDLSISKKTIYTHFKNKTELVKDCAFWAMRKITHGIDEICLLNQDPIAEIYEIKKFVIKTIGDDQSTPQYQLQKYYPEISESLKQEYYKKMMACTRRNLERGIENGIYRKNLNVEFIARLYFMTIQGLNDQILFPLKQFSAQFILGEYLEYHLRGIVTSTGLITLNKFIKEQHTDE